MPAEQRPRDGERYRLHGFSFVPRARAVTGEVSVFSWGPYPMQSAYPCNRAIVAYEPSNLNPTVTVILHLNPPPHQQYSL